MKPAQKSKTGKTEKDAPRGQAPRPLAVMLPKVTGPVLGKRGLAESGIVNSWPEIVGRELAMECHPDRLSRPRHGSATGTLHILVTGGIALELQHLAPLVIERINSHYGYQAVDRLKFVHAPRQLKRTAKRAEAAPELSPSQRQRLADSLSTVDDPELKEILTRIGAAVLNRP